LEGINAKDAHEPLDEVLNTLWSIDMNIRGAGVLPRPGSRVEKWDKIRDMIGMKVRKDNMIYLVVVYACFQQTLHSSMSAIEQDVGVVQLKQNA
jgi:hypothetical protein